MPNSYPLLPIYRNEDKPDLQPDYILEDLTNGFTYICHKYDNPATGVEANAMDIWRICRIQNITTATTVTTVFTYPYGCAGYNFNVDDIATYDYQYKR